MATKQRSSRTSTPYRWEYGKLVPRAEIRRYARQIAERFQPEKITLFGSYAYGKPNKDSDVDILVVMPAYNHISQAVKIRMALPDPPFSLDLIVRAPKRLAHRLELGDSFMHEIVDQGQVLYEKGNGAVDSQGRRRFRRNGTPSQRRSSVP